MVCNGNGVNVSLAPADMGSMFSLWFGAVVAPNNFGMGPIVVVLLGVGGVAALGCGVGGVAGAGDGSGSCDSVGVVGSACVCGSGEASAEGCFTFGSAGGAEFNLFFLPQRAGT